MSYPSIHSQNFTEDLLNRKEFFSLKIDPDRNFRDVTDDELYIDKYLKIHSHQLFVKNFMNPNTPYKRLHLMHATGCHAAGTEILMYDGGIKRVEDVKIGDKLMGDDNLPRSVDQLISNFELMYKVVTENGDSFICNENHILSVMDKDGIVIDISIVKLLEDLSFYNKYRLFRVVVQFKHISLSVDPYKFGTELINYTTIPHKYKCNSIDNRNKLLAGLLDTIGNYDTIAKRISIDVTYMTPQLVKDISYLCKSLGFNISVMIHKSTHFIYIYGKLSQIPSKLISFTDSDTENCTMMSRFQLIKLSVDKYYGFSINRNRRYVLANFIVTHNTGKCHAKDTLILMYNGTLKAVQDIKIGDQIMGDDSTERNILEVARGRESMVRVNLDDGDSFICNRSHIITVNVGGTVMDIPISYFLDYPNVYSSRYYMFRTGVEFKKIDVEMNPYQYGLQFNRNKITFIPYMYKCNSRTNRLQFLAGIIDATGVYTNNYFKIFITDAQNDMIYLCQSLGLTTKLIGNYLFINGNSLGQVPTRSVVGAYDEYWADYAKCAFTLTELPVDDYYGFVIDHNHRYVLGNFIVTHNTIAAISIAQEFIKVFKKMHITAISKITTKKTYSEIDRMTPNIFVLGFGGTKAAFVRDLLKYPDFGFVTLEEKDELLKRQKIADIGLPDDVKHLKEYYTMLKKRITSKNRGGFYKFYGYDKFVNRLFLSDNIKLTELENEVANRIRNGEDSLLLEDVIHNYISSGQIQVNIQLLNMLENSLIICDEIHNTYNMHMKNNRGVAIQFILNLIPTLRFLSMSATPFNNSPTEIIDWLNFLISPDRKITKKEFFVNNRTLYQGKLNEIGKLIQGKMSFLQDTNIKYFPERIFVGESIEIPGYSPDKMKELTGSAEYMNDKYIPYLKFIKCPMSKLQQATYIHYLKNVGEYPAEPVDTTYDRPENEDNSDDDDDINGDDNTIISSKSIDEFINTEYSYHSIPIDGYSIFDIVFPNPDTKDYGLFRSTEIKNKLFSAPQEWKDSVGLNIKKTGSSNTIINGEFLSSKNIGEYSSKCATLLDILLDIIRESDGNPDKCQKTMIYHDRVEMSGVLLIQELLRENNFIDEYSEPVDSTLCCICCKPLRDHEMNHSHVYKPVRFMTVHSYMDKITMERNLAKYNSRDNINGLNYMIFIGSKIIKESYDFKCVRNVIIMSLPVNIPTAIQIIGRSVRKNSHIDLPPNQRTVKIRILLSIINEKYEHVDPISPEMYRYIDKLYDYISIQKLERELNKNTLDADIHRDIIMQPGILDQYFDNNGNIVNSIGNLYFESSYTIPNYALSDLNLTTFNAYKYYEDEIKLITYIIKRLFIIQPIWIYDDLWNAVRMPPINVEINPKLFLENNFIISLNNLVTNTTTVISQKPSLTENILLDHIFDPMEKFIYINGQKHKIEHIESYYILFPVTQININPLNTLYVDYADHIRDKEMIMIKTSTELNDNVIIDIESYIRPAEKKTNRRININKFVKDNKESVNYYVKRDKLLDTINDENIIEFLIDYNASFQMKFIEEAISHLIIGDNVFNIPPRLYKLYQMIINLLDKFRVIIYLKEVIKYKDTAKQYKYPLTDLPDNLPMGYMTTKSVKLFDTQINIKEINSIDIIENSRWIEISKIALNRQIIYKENDIIIGYLESAEENMKFKLRKPIHKIKENIKDRKNNTDNSKNVKDARNIEKGIVCNTKNKHDLLHIISLLTNTNTVHRSELRIWKLCSIIKNILIKNEIDERTKDSRYKYFYSWWDDPINLNNII